MGLLDLFRKSKIPSLRRNEKSKTQQQQNESSYIRNSNDLDASS